MGAAIFGIIDIVLYLERFGHTVVPQEVFGGLFPRLQNCGFKKWTNVTSTRR